MIPPTINLPRVTQYQRDAIFCEERNAMIEATTKAGKTLGCILWLLTLAGSPPKPNAEYWWVAPVAEQADIAFRRVIGMLAQTDPTRTVWRENLTKHEIKFGQSFLRFKGSDKPDSLYGEDVYAAVIDEASRCKEEAYHAVRSTMTATNGRMRIIGNVKGRHNWAYRLARKVEAGNLPGWRYAKIRAADAVKAGVIDAEEVEAARRELPEAVFRELYEAEPSEDGSNPFGLGHIAECVTALSSGAVCCFGVDLAKSVDWTVLVGLDELRRPCLFERWQHVPWQETTDRILQITAGKPTLIDSTGVGDPIVEALQRRAPNVEGFKFTSASKQQLMEGLAVAIQGHTVGILDGVMRMELESFEYEHTRTGVRYTAPEGLHDDCVMALALAVERARQFVTPAFSLTSVARPTNPDTLPDKAAPTESVAATMARKRRDLNWGWR